VNTEQQSDRYEGQLVRGIVDLTNAARVGSTAGIVTTLSRLVNGWAALIDRYGIPIAHVGAARVHIDTAIAAAAGTRPRSADDTVSSYPVGHALEPKAQLVVSGKLAFRGLTRELSQHAASLLDLTFGPAIHPRLEAIARADAVESLLSTDAELARRTAARWGFQGQGAALAVVQSTSRSVALEPHVLGWLRDLTIAPCAMSVGQQITVVLDPVTVDSWMARVSLAADDGLPIRCGVGDSAPWGRVRDGAARAELALEVAIARKRPTVRFDKLSLAATVLDGLGATSRAALEVPITQLDAADPSGVLRQSARAYLAENGSLEGASTLVGVHRHTMRSRIASIEQITGLSMTDADDRATLWLALRAASAGTVL